ncbi:SARP family transcriptional regulator [Streptomyces lucensis JCM 4490]|uniref:SARP family transcriptional regulator n=1 Tax=Streptomyces lucensis JCM 4490 TaxID=1306176 RepID=A0A918J8H9_9ACTN|nr:AfsR/SARP family transcriptional regulator [Streptomyces lucensis]GGW53320.1 SARP family transcriptional regulator [Streptomyces lucensis JCM 4490]
MRVNLLGPLEIYAGEPGVNAVPAAQKVRQTLAVLILNANRVVRFEQLMEELWEDNPPARAHTALQTYVYQIRKRFDLGNPRSDGHDRDTGRPVLGTVDGGYQLTLPEDHVDAFRFEPLIARARKDFRAGDHPTARDRVAAALALWRDTALVDVRKGPLLEAEALRLNELHTSANQLRIEADLHLGRHHELLSELTSLAALEPTNESHQRNLMTALYRTDRRADALRVYQRARTLIADEFGLDPSPELQALHTAILQSDDNLLRTTGPSAPAPASAPRVPCHLPAPHERLTGRGGQLARATSALRSGVVPGPALVVVGGAPGTGKTALCLHAARQVSDHYPDGQLYGRLLDDSGRPVAHADILRSFLRGLGATEDLLRLGATDLSLMFRSWTADRRVLVVLDDVTGPDDLGLLLPSGRRCGAVISSRRRLFVPSCTEHIELTRLPLDDCLHLLVSSVPEHRITMDPHGSRELAELCHGLPGALSAVAARLRLRPHWTARQALTWATAAARSGEDPLGLRTALERTLVTLPGNLRGAVPLLLSCDGADRPTPAAAAALLGTDEQRAANLLEDLVDAYLLSAPASGPAGDHPCTGDHPYLWEPPLQALRAATGEPVHRAEHSVAA